jgi:hypothetical protein
MKPKRVVAVRFDEPLIRELRKAARADGRLFGPFVRDLLRDALTARVTVATDSQEAPQATV